ncbi:MAG: quinoprotein dehydrogenase-associated SoxYZ-like carrier [Gammaproteobacteria bacterium]|nr:quinoprotein dehydrogenase-associated SoxYZ-like carrier [Gammaproteobacteria bacterium]
MSATFWRGLCLALLVMSAWGSCAAAEESEVDVWATLLRPQHFGDREISEGKDLVELRLPARAEDAGVVPISINAKIPQTAERYIRTLYIFIDRNPRPLAGKFELTPAMGKADMAMRLRINQFTDVRVVAETSDGHLYMDKGYTRASGGCSAPPPFLELKEAREHIGEMKFHAQSSEQDGDVALGQLLISHPNITGMQLDQRTRAYLPAEYVTKVTLKFNGEHILSAETDISISEDPSFRFFFKPKSGGTMVAEMTDSKGRQFSHSFEVAGAADTVAR